MEIGDGEEEDNEEDSENCDNVLLLESGIHVGEARGGIFDVEGGGEVRGRRFAVVMVDEVAVVILLLVGGGVHMHYCVVGHGGD